MILIILLMAYLVVFLLEENATKICETFINSLQEKLYLSYMDNPGQSSVTDRNSAEIEQGLIVSSQQAAEAFVDFLTWTIDRAAEEAARATGFIDLQSNVALRHVERVERFTEICTTTFTDREINCTVRELQQSTLNIRVTGGTSQSIRQHLAGRNFATMIVNRGLTAGSATMNAESFIRRDASSGEE